MRGKNLLWTFLVALLLTSAVMTGTVTSSPSARMYVDPPEVKGYLEYPTGSNFTVDIKVDVGVGVDEPTLYGWDFSLSFVPSVLQVASHIEEQSIIDSWIGDGANVTFATTGKPVIPGSEMVFVNFTLVDYTIDYETGEITFTTAPGVGADIRAFYSYYVTVYHVTNGQFLEETGWDTAWKLGMVAPDVDNFNGLVSAGDVILADEETGILPDEGVSGTGKVLATIEFEVIGNGVCLLDLESTELATVVGDPPYQTFTPIAHTVENGLFDNRDENQGPIALFAAPTHALEGEEVTFDASDSTDDGWIVSYGWDFGYMREYMDQWIALGISKTDRWTGDNETKSFITTQKPIEGSEKVYVNDKPVDYTIDYETGNITLTTAPGLGAAVKAIYLYLQKSFVTTEKPVVPDSEEVYVNEILMTKPAEYTIDYETGEITFTTAPEKGAKVKTIYYRRAEDSGMTTTHTFATAGTYIVSLTVTDNNGKEDTATQPLTVMKWTATPDLVKWEAKPERHRLNEAPGVRGMNLSSMVGNPTSDAYEAYVEFTVFSKDEGNQLGTLTTETVELEPGENRELTVYLNITDPTWRAFSGAWASEGSYHDLLHKYIVFASAYSRPVDDGDNDFVKGYVQKEFGFNVVPVEHDIAVVEVTTNAINGSVPEGDVLEIYVNMTNQGDLWEPFDITVTYTGRTTPETELEVRPTTLEGNETRIETFILDTSGMTAERYVIRAILSTLIYELDTVDNKASCLIEVIE